MMTYKPAKDGLSDADIALLEKLASMRDRGILTQQEFEGQKAVILGITDANRPPIPRSDSVPTNEPNPPAEWEAWDRWGKKPILPNQHAFDKLEKDLIAVEKKLEKPTSPPKIASTWGDWGDSPLAGRTDVRDLGAKLSANSEPVSKTPNVGITPGSIQNSKATKNIFMGIEDEFKVSTIYISAFFSTLLFYHGPLWISIYFKNDPIGSLATVMGSAISPFGISFIIVRIWKLLSPSAHDLRVYRLRWLVIQSLLIVLMVFQKARTGT